MLEKPVIFYDGLCHLCSREINAYRQINHQEKLAFVDIADSQFDPSAEGFDADEVQRVLHVKRADGTLATGVDAFIAIWDALEIFPWLIFLAERQPTRLVMQVGYEVFARIRPLLPKKACTIDKP